MSESLHAVFCDWMLRNRASMSREAFEAGEIVARWLYVIESGVPRTVLGRKAAANAFRKFEELCRSEPPSRT